MDATLDSNLVEYFKVLENSVFKALSDTGTDYIVQDTEKDRQFHDYFIKATHNRVEEIYQRFIILEKRRCSTRQSIEMQQSNNGTVSSGVDERSTISAPDVPRDITSKFDFTHSVEHSTPIFKNDVTQPSPMPIDETPKRIVNEEPHSNKDSLINSIGSMPELAAVDPEDCPKAAPSNRRTNLKRKLDTSTNSSIKMDSTKKQKLDSTFSIETAPVGDLDPVIGLKTDSSSNEITNKPKNISKKNESNRKKASAAKHNHQCDECDYSSSVSTNFKKHMKTKHSKNISVGKSTNGSTQKVSRTRSVRRKPAEAPQRRSYECHLCKYQTRDRTTINNHFRHKHTGEKPFECNVCQKTFTQRAGVEAHQMIHYPLK